MSSIGPIYNIAGAQRSDVADNDRKQANSADTEGATRSLARS